MKSYEKYKPTRVEWIGEIPEHWTVKRLKTLSKLEYGESLAVISREEGDIPVFGSNGITGFHTSSITNAPCIVVGRKGSYGKINWSAKECFPIDTTYYIDNSKTDQHLRWLYYILPNLGLDLFSKDTGVPGLSREDAYQNLIPLPNFEEQTAIANYLDEKTVQIDTLIEKKQKLIELLKEERTAIINQAVTKGINPKVKFKPSGIEWLGDIPEHWEVKRLKYLSEIKTGEKNTEDRVEDGMYPFFVRSQEIERINSYSFEGEAILTAGDGVGVAKVFHYYNGKFDYHQRVYRISHFKEVIGKYLFYYLKVNLIKEILRYNAKSTVDSLRLPMFQNFLIIYPKDTEEQTAIVQQIETSTQKIDATISKIEREIELMQEYRTAIISEVVTGKIKVI